MFVLWYGHSVTKRYENTHFYVSFRERFKNESLYNVFFGTKAIKSDVLVFDVFWPEGLSKQSLTMMVSAVLGLDNTD